MMSDPRPFDDEDIAAIREHHDDPRARAVTNWLATIDALTVKLSVAQAFSKQWAREVDDLRAKLQAAEAVVKAARVLQKNVGKTLSTCLDTGPMWHALDVALVAAGALDDADSGR